MVQNIFARDGIVFWSNLTLASRYTLLRRALEVNGITNKESRTMKTTTKSGFSYTTLIKIFVFIAVMAIIYYGVRDYVNLANFKQMSAHFKELADTHYHAAVMYYCLLYALMVIFALPIIFLNLVGGFLFGTLLGAAYSTLASVVGSVVSFMLVRYLFAGFITQRLGKQRLERFNEHVAQYGMNYLLMLHYSCVVPFFVINSLAALTTMHVRKFIVVTVLGSFPISFLYAFAGRQLGSISSVSDVFSPDFVAALVIMLALAFAPMLWKRIKGKSLDV